MTEIIFPDRNNHSKVDARSFLSLKGQPNPILIVGMHNSGTSILTEIIHENGIFFGANMKHHESYFFTNFINDKIIFGGGGNWAKLPLMSVEEVLSFESSVGPFIKKHWIADYMQWGYDGVSPWGIKDPRLSVLLPLYLRIFPEAKVVHIHRNPDDVAASLSGKHKEGVGILNDFDHWKSLTEAHTQRIQEYSESCFAYFDLSYEDFCTEPQEQVHKLFKFLDLAYTRKTERLLKKVSTSSIGAYQRMLDSQNNPWRSKLKSFFLRQSK